MIFLYIAAFLIACIALAGYALESVGNELGMGDRTEYAQFQDFDGREGESSDFGGGEDE